MRYRSLKASKGNLGTNFALVTAQTRYGSNRTIIITDIKEDKDQHV